VEDLERLFAELSDAGASQWVDLLRSSSREILAPKKHGHLTKWREIISQLPEIPVRHTDFASPAATFGEPIPEDQQMKLREQLRAFHPWRKGPFSLFGIHLDTEWRSDLKWQRIVPHVEMADKDILDIGCGNGYYGWRMLGAGARRVVGIEPYPLYNMQHAIFKHYAPQMANYVVPASDRDLVPNLRLFDIVFSMGVLYHSKHPIGHLESLRQAIKPGGVCVLETLVIEGNSETALFPKDRYAKMRNVWLIPSTLMLDRLLKRVGFKHIELVDVTSTTSTEQRSTEWMTFESLADFLDPDDSTLTFEGYPAPRRAIFVASI